MILLFVFVDYIETPYSEIERDSFRKVENSLHI
jgi:hypothetical protein